MKRMAEDFERNEAKIRAEADERVRKAESKSKGFWDKVGGGFEDFGKAIGGGTAFLLTAGCNKDAEDFAGKSWRNLLDI